MVDRFDEGIISPDLGALDYKGLYKVRRDEFIYALSVNFHQFMSFSFVSGCW